MTSSRRHHLKVNKDYEIKLSSSAAEYVWVQTIKHETCLMMISVLQSLILQIAMNWIEQEKKETETAKQAYMAEHCSPPDLSGDQAALMVRETSGFIREKRKNKK